MDTCLCQLHIMCHGIIIECENCIGTDLVYLVTVLINFLIELGMRYYSTENVICLFNEHALVN